MENISAFILSSLPQKLYEKEIGHLNHPLLCIKTLFWGPER